MTTAYPYNSKRMQYKLNIDELKVEYTEVIQESVLSLLF